MEQTERGHRVSPLNHSPEALKYALKQSQLSQREVAQNLGVSEGYFSEMLKGTRNVNQARLVQLARIFNCPVVILEAKVDETPKS